MNARRKTLIHSAILGICLTPLATHAEPLRLSDSQLDSATAGTLLLTVDAQALAIGPSGFTLTDSRSRAVRRSVFDVGYGAGSALACCGPLTAAEVSTNVSADGATVLVKRRRIEMDTTQYTYVRERIFVISLP